MKNLTYLRAEFLTKYILVFVVLYSVHVVAVTMDSSDGSPSEQNQVPAINGFPDYNYEYRKDKKLNASFNFSAGAYTTQGFMGSYFLNPEQHLMFDLQAVSAGPFANLFGGLFGRRVEIKGSLVGLHYKKFIRSDLYWRSGIEHLRLNYEEEQDSWLSWDTSRKDSFNSTSVNLVLGFGSSWQWRRFAMSIDWLTVSVPLSSSGSEFSSSGDTVSIKNKKEFFLKEPKLMMGFQFGLSL